MPGSDSVLTPQLHGNAVTVSIYDQVYTLRGEDREWIERLAELVDARMRAVAAHGSTVDSLRVAILAALNLADDLVIAQNRCKDLSGVEQSHRTRAHSLAGLLDTVLDGGLIEDVPVRKAG